jgi:predicted transcriptional regulator
MGNVKRKAKATVMRLEAVEMNRRGLSNEAIAAKLGVNQVSVVRYLNEFLSSQAARWPTTLTVEDVQQMRSQEREHLEHLQQQILQRVAGLSPDPAESLELLVAASSSFAKLSERKSKLLGIDSPQPKPPETINNTLMLNGGVTQEDALRDLIAYKALQLQQNGRQP